MVSFKKVTVLNVLVRKKDGSLRLCIDYRRLNAKTVRYQFPLPRIKESIDAIGNAKLFPIIDLASGFNQVAMDEEDQQHSEFLNTKECPWE